MRELERLLGSDYRPPHAQRSAVARGLPPAAYTSEAFFELECERLFARTWVFAGFVQDVAQTGDVWPTLVAGKPVMLVRSDSHTVRAFHNVCRHRGHLLVDEPCREVRKIVCPYHAWTYALTGDLLRTPNFGGAACAEVSGFERSANGLIEVRCAAWHDWVFVNLSGDAPPLGTHLNGVEARLRGLDWPSLTPVAKLETGVVRSNWKFLIENFVEPYHVPVVHTRTAAGQPLKNHEMFVDTDCFGCIVTVSDPPPHRGLADYLDMSSHYLAVFPNFILARYFPDQIGVHLNQPLGADRTRQWRAIYSTGKVPFDREKTKALIELWRRVHAEDHRATEQLQAGRASPGAADGGVLSPHWEISIAHFHDRVIACLQ